LILDNAIIITSDYFFFIALKVIIYYELKYYLVYRI